MSSRSSLVMDERYKHHLDYMGVILRKSTVHNERRVQFRPSSFPICPRLVALHELRKLAYGQVFQIDRFVNDPYFSMGTSAHEVYQSWLGRIGSLFGVWRCSHKTVVSSVEGGDGRVYQEIVRCNYSVEQWGTDLCPRCSLRGRRVWMLYDEYDLKGMGAEFGLSSAHVDGAMYLGDGRHTYPIEPGSDLEPDTVLELKTTSEADFKTRKEPKSVGHLQQASTYAELLRRLKGWDIKHLVYGYVNRNHPWQVRFFRHEPLPVGTLELNAWRFHLGKQWPRNIEGLPQGLCSSLADAKGFTWWGMKWMGCPEAQTCFGDGCGGLSSGEETWVDRALEKLAREKKEKDHDD